MSYSSTVLADSPLAYWHLDESSGTIFADSSGSARNLTITGAPTFGQPPVTVTMGGTSVGFSGTNQYASLAAPAWLSAPVTFSLELWVLASTVGSAGAFLINQDNSDVSTTDARRMYQLAIRPSGVIRFECYNTAGGIADMTSPNSYLDGAWHHVVVTFNNGTMTLYVDGVSVATGTQTGSLNSGGTSPLEIASTTAYSTNGDSRVSLQGSLDEVAVYGNALTATRVQAHFSAAGVSPVSSALSLSAIEAATVPAAIPVTLSESYVEVSTVPTAVPRNLSLHYLEVLTPVRRYIGWGTPA